MTAVDHVIYQLNYQPVNSHKQSLVYSDIYTLAALKRD
jgi:hypothetical protein